METTEGNKLIAEFMGSSFKTYKKGHIRKDSVTVCYFDDGMSPFSGGVSIENLKYHSSWDWLMPCIGKISNKCEEPEELDGLKYALLCCDIDTAYNFVVDYLENKPQ